MVDGLGTSRKLGISRFASSQFEYSMLNRSSETEMSPACRRFGVGIIPYLPLAAGMLTGKALGDSSPLAGSRLALEQGTAQKWITPANLATVAALRTFAARLGHPLVELVIAWLLAQPQVCTVITGATSPRQVEQNAAASSWRLTPGDLKEVEGILGRLPPTSQKGYFSVAAYFTVP
jgi:aryl-alcohol dehydrogenase-like predicted oxidoreductase